MKKGDDKKKHDSVLGVSPIHRTWDTLYPHLSPDPRFVVYDETGYLVLQDFDRKTYFVTRDKLMAEALRDPWLTDDLLILDVCKRFKLPQLAWAFRHFKINGKRMRTLIYVFGLPDKTSIEHPDRHKIIVDFSEHPETGVKPATAD